MSNNDTKLDIARRIADGTAVDWAATNPDDPVVRNLRLVESLARTLRDSDADSPTGADTLGPGSRWEQLEVRRLLDQGTSARVYLAWDPSLEREVALKLYDSKSATAPDSLLKEGRLLARIEHPNVVRVYGAAEHAGQIGLWMEPVVGETLAQRVERGEQLGPDEALAWGRALADALAAVHGAGLVHGDIKAQNVMRRRDGRIVLMDFGAGRYRAGPLADGEDQSRLSGTPLYLAPEVLRGAMPDQGSDLYALGVLLFHGLTGRFPYEAGSVPELQAIQAARGPQRLEDLRPGLPDPLLSRVQQALDPDPARRFKTAGAMAAAFAETRAPEPAVSPNRWKPVLAVLATAILAFAGWQMMAPGSGKLAGPPEYFLSAGFHRLSPDAERIALIDGATVAPGDVITLDLGVTQDTWVYLYNEDDQGLAYALFPLPGQAGGNPLPPGEAHRLPGGEPALGWRVTSAGGTERIHLVTSPHRLPSLEQLLAALPPAARKPIGLDGFSPRGIGGLSDLDHPPPAPVAALQAETDRLTGGKGLEGVHHQVLVLSNPR